MLSTEATIGRLVAERPGRSRVFEALGIDYCCGGDRPLGEVCAEKGLDAPTVVRMLDVGGWPVGGLEDGRDWSGSSVAELTEHIVEVHHRYLREALPRLEFLVGKVAAVHGERHRELAELRAAFGALKPELEAHLSKEEEVLFPMCRELEVAQAKPDFRCRTVNDPISTMVAEHEEVGRVLARMRGLTGGYEPPVGACNTYRAMLDGLKDLERDVHLHVHEENNVLFPKVSAIEAALSAGA